MPWLMPEGQSLDQLDQLLEDHERRTTNIS